MPSDHADCKTGFKCANGQCIFLAWRCDDEPDCEDESDEESCGKTTLLNDIHITLNVNISLSPVLVQWAE